MANKLSPKAQQIADLMAEAGEAADLGAVLAAHPELIGAVQEYHTWAIREAETAERKKPVQTTGHGLKK